MTVMDQLKRLRAESRATSMQNRPTWVAPVKIEPEPEIEQTQPKDVINSGVIVGPVYLDGSEVWELSPHDRWALGASDSCLQETKEHPYDTARRLPFRKFF